VKFVMSERWDTLVVVFDLKSRETNGGVEGVGLNLAITGGGEDVREDIDGELAVLSSIVKDDYRAGAHHARDGPAHITDWRVQRVRDVGGAKDNALACLLNRSEKRWAEKGGWWAHKARLLAGNIGYHIGGFAHGIASLGGRHGDGGSVGNKVVGEFVAMIDDTAGECGVLTHLLGHHEEGGVSLSFGEQVEDMDGVFGVGAIIKGKSEYGFLGGDVEEYGGKSPTKGVDKPAGLIEPAADREAGGCDGH